MEEQHYFKRRIKAYTVLLKTEAYQALFGTRALTAAFTTLADDIRLHQMRKWAQQELQTEPVALTAAFYFTSLCQPLLPRQVWLEPLWYSAHMSEQPTALLAAARR
jgi:hypothetical protein